MTTTSPALNVPAGSPRPRYAGYLLPVSMSSCFAPRLPAGQIRTMDSQKPPIKVLSPGRVFRSDCRRDPQLPCSTQMEGLGRGQGHHSGRPAGRAGSTLVQKLFGEGYHAPVCVPLTSRSPSPALRSMSAASSAAARAAPCASTPAGSKSWAAVLSTSKVLENCNIDPDEYSGFAFGIGIERIAMLKYGINNIGLMFENNLQFLKQFHE